MELFFDLSVGYVSRFKFASRRSDAEKEKIMLYYALMFLLVALVAALFGFGGIASASAGIAQILFFIFVILFVATLILRAVRS